MSMGLTMFGRQKCIHQSLVFLRLKFVPFNKWTRYKSPGLDQILAELGFLYSGYQGLFLWG
jgi:hypothetical protein